MGISVDELEVRARPDGKELLMVFHLSSGPNFVFTMSAQRVDEMFVNVAICRRLMTPPVPTEWNSPDVIVAQTNPSYKIETDLMIGGALLHLRHPGLGWGHTLFSKDRARKIAGELLRIADEPEPLMQGNG